MSSIFNISNIILNNNLTTQEEVLKKIAEIAVNNGIASFQEEVVNGLKKREGEGSTGFMEGFAIPHTKSSGVHNPAIVIITLSNGVEWNSMDGQPAKFIISLLIPDGEAGTTHLSFLSSISRALMHSEVRQKLLNAENAEVIFNELKQATNL